jgi:protein-S-isoprenylcysteine O-methyltransferase Ste14
MSGNDNKGVSPVVAAMLFTVLVPLPMGVGIPFLITRWQMQPPLTGFEAGRWLGVLMIVIGAVLLLSAIAWFAYEGVKPYPPIERVITTGPYAYTRNPMYGGVVLIMVGQGLLFGSLGTVVYGVGWLITFYVFEWTIDDPFIVKRMGTTYEDYCRDVPGWIPRRPKRR